MDPDLEIFLQAPENPSPEELTRYLDEACGHDKHLRSRVEALFVADGVEEGIVDQAPKISNSSEPLEAEGNIIHNYKLLQKIGEGGFGDVYMAEQFNPLFPDPRSGRTAFSGASCQKQIPSSKRLENNRCQKPSWQSGLESYADE